MYLTLEKNTARKQKVRQIDDMLTNCHVDVVSSNRCFRENRLFRMIKCIGCVYLYRINEIYTECMRFPVEKIRKTSIKKIILSRENH